MVDKRVLGKNESGRESVEEKKFSSNLREGCSACFVVCLSDVCFTCLLSHQFLESLHSTRRSMFPPPLHHWLIRRTFGRPLLPSEKWQEEGEDSITHFTDTHQDKESIMTTRAREWHQSHRRHRTKKNEEQNILFYQSLHSLLVSVVLRSVSSTDPFLHVIPRAFMLLF